MQLHSLLFAPSQVCYGGWTHTYFDVRHHDDVGKNLVLRILRRRPCVVAAALTA